jgi:hypothetical protein
MGRFHPGLGTCLRWSPWLFGPPMVTDPKFMCGWICSHLAMGIKHTERSSWLKTEHGMGHGHANALVAYWRASHK